MRVPWPALLALLLAAPVAGAAPARLALDVPPLAPLLPGAERTVAANLTYSYEAPAANQTLLTLVPVEAPAWLNARVEPGSARVNATEGRDRVVVPLRLTIGVRAGTPALQQHTLQVQLRAEANPPLEAVTASAGVVVRVAYDGRLRVEALQEVVSAKPGDPANLGLRFTNEGNGPARVSLEAVAAPDRVEVRPPSVFVVETNGTLRERVVNVSVLSEQAGRYPLTLRYANAHAFDPTLTAEGGEVSVTFEVVSAGAPGFEAPFLALALGLAARRLSGSARRCRR